MDLYLKLAAVGTYFISMLAIGLYSYIKTSSQSSESYMLAGRNLGPMVTALSAGASDMSGWLLMGLPGAMYAIGLSSIWMAIGLTVGAYFNYILVAPKLRIYSELKQSVTIPDFLSNRVYDKSHILSLVAGIVILIFFTLYVSSGIVAGGTFFESAFKINYSIGIIVITSIVVLYTTFGGFMGVSLTDFVQGTIMVAALIVVPIITIYKIGGINETVSIVYNTNHKLFSLFQGTSFLSIVGLLAWGLGYFGQPHIIVRFMAIKSVEQIPSARRIGISWMLFCVVGAMSIGLVGLAYVQKFHLSLDNPEAIFIFLADIIFNPFIAGILLSAILAAIMSTISSQLLVSASAVANDIFKVFSKRVVSDKVIITISKLSIVVIAILALLLANNKNNSILNLVGHAWAGFGSTFGPCVLLSLHWNKTTRNGLLAGLIVGAITVLVWINIPVLHDNMYEMIPGFILSTLAIIIVSLLDKKGIYQNEHNS
ncbi:MAG: sodium/proline symporter PutP [Solitalea-like symbiont of Tyrophagus putrescentiae]